MTPGGTSGIGKQTCSVLMSKGATVYLASRDAERSKATITKLNSMHSKSNTDTKASLHFLQLDLASLDSIKAAAEEFKSKEERLDVLFNNAGVMDAPKGSTTEDGYEMHFGTNVL
jgi:retinol dehydrogenase-12